MWFQITRHRLTLSLWRFITWTLYTDLWINKNNNNSSRCEKGVCWNCKITEKHEKKNLQNNLNKYNFHDRTFIYRYCHSIILQLTTKKKCRNIKTKMLHQLLVTAWEVFLFHVNICLEKENPSHLKSNLTLFNPETNLETSLKEHSDAFSCSYML